MVDDSDSSSQIIDIISPSAPLASGGSDWILSLAAAGFALALWLLWRWYRSERRQGLHSVAQLKIAYRNREIATRDVVYWLAAFLKRRLNVSHLSLDNALPAALEKESGRWQSFLLRLHVARYSSNPLTDGDIAILLAETRYWMKRWP